ncbi:MAG: isochorismatase family protein [Streptosporangiales bacterium]|nr:isochorismatase family protein [Streptosporangiales bacterium]
MTAEHFGVDELRAAVVTIDLHRGHLDPGTATLPLRPEPAGRVVSANARFLESARMGGLPVVHVVTVYRDLEEIHSNPFWKAIDATENARGDMRRHNMKGSAGTQLMPGILGPGDRVLETKKRYDCFLGTELDFVLRTLRVNTLLLTGVNTNSCVLTTTVAASSRDYAPIVVADCVDTMDGPDFHRMALACIERAFGWVMRSDEALRAVRAGGGVG